MRRVWGALRIVRFDRPIGGIRQDRTIIRADVSDRVWSETHADTAKVEWQLYSIGI